MRPDSIRRRLIALILTLAAGVLVQAQSARKVPTDSEIRQILADRVDKYRQSVGIVVGVIDPKA
jgi:hypothetical protein